MKTSFKSFLRVPAKMNEGVQHLEDLSLEDFIDAVENLNKMIATDKLDGTNLWFGLDMDGKFYTSREGKRSSAKVYDVKDYKLSIGTNGIRATHGALEDNLKEIKKILKPGDAIEVEILYGRQPNSVVYGKDGMNYIAFLRTIRGQNGEDPDQDKTDKLLSALKSKTTNVKTTNIDTNDGVQLIKVPTMTSWRFVKPEKIDAGSLDTVNIKSQLTALKKYLNKENEDAIELTSGVVRTNFDVIKSKKQSLSDEKKKVNEIVMNKFKLSIKNEILDNFVRKIKPSLQDDKLDDDEAENAEGVVFLDPKTSKQFKVVDKDIFTAINKFNYNVRNNVSGAVKTDDPLADLASRGGIFGEAKTRILGIFDIKGLGIGGNTKKILGKFKGREADETLNNMAENFKEMSVQAVRKKILAILDNTLDELNKSLESFKENSSTYKLTLKNGKTIGYSKEIIKRTLLNFAETRRRIVDQKKQFGKVDSMKGILVVLFGQKIKELHEGGSKDD
jgi:hypothetical protein